LTQATTDNVLVQRALAGDEDSFTALCERYYAALVAIAHAILGDRHLAEDAAQQALAKAALNLHRLKKIEQFGSWVAAICRNAARDLGRGNRRFESRLETPEPVTEPQRDDAGPAVRAALDRLEPPAREVIFLRFYDGLSYEQIGAVLGISEQAINGRLRRAKKKLAQHLRRAGFGEVQI
jgi:RNA polymerase sigma-70 factor (ECF subfamily)